MEDNSLNIHHHSFSIGPGHINFFSTSSSRGMRIARLIEASHPLRANCHVKKSRVIGLVLQARWLSFSATSSRWSDISRTRNIGIIAHIDAGKTTTTERMLYYSGFTRRIGNVDEGSTVTDFLPAERARGITIQSAAITFQWPPIPDQRDHNGSEVYDINLIDTPGHADFTFEVIRSLRVLDGAVCILDGVAGVEAQTEKVWNQANGYQIPRIIFVNKLDRNGAAFARTVKEIGAKLHVWPATCMIPWWTQNDRKLQGLGDVANLRALLWKEGSDGRDIQAFGLQDLEKVDDSFAQELEKARVALIELLSEHDDQVVEKYLEFDEDHLAIRPPDILASLRRCVLQQPQRVVPIFSGASFRNLGVQPLLDSINQLLPSPLERPSPEISLTGQNGALAELLDGTILKQSETKAISRKQGQRLAVKTAASPSLLKSCALAFKVVNDPKRGVLVYVRVYSGSLNRGSSLWNTNLSLVERAPRLLRMYANDAIEIPSIEAGQIGVIVGLKHARTGDTLVSYANMNPRHGPPSPINTLHLKPIAVPPPVFFVSVEPNSLSEERHIMDSLEILLREDPSLSVTTDPETGQTQLAGMGELHLEIARDRLVQDFKAKAVIGKIEIGYRESILDPTGPFTARVDREIAGKAAKASTAASVAPLDAHFSDTTSIDGDTEQTVMLADNNRLTIFHPNFDSTGKPLDVEDPPLPPHLIMPTIYSALEAGVTAALAKGPKHGYPLHSTSVTIKISSSDISLETSAAALSMAARQAVQTALKATSDSALMEPVMLASISVPESAMGSVVHDLNSARGAQIMSLGGDESDSSTTTNTEFTSHAPSAFETFIDTRKIYTPPDPFGSPGTEITASSDAVRTITARVPLREMVGYLKYLRSLTQGRGTFVMSVEGFEKVKGQRLKVILGELRSGIV